jgi:hypothetical protein
MNTGNNVNNILIQYNSSWLAEFSCRTSIESALMIVEKGASSAGKLLFMRKVWQAGIHDEFMHAIAYSLSRT